MKKIEAIIRPEKVSVVRKALNDLPFAGLTISQVDGHGKQRGAIQKLNGQEYRVGILPKTKIEIIVEDKNINKVLDAIMMAARTGGIGDGKIFIYPVEEVIRIRTGEKGKNAL